MQLRKPKRPRQVRLCRIASVPYHLASLNQQLSCLAEAGIAVDLVSSGGEDTARLTLRDQHITILIERQISLVSDLMAVWKLFRLFRTRRYQIVHSDTPKAGLLSALAGRLARVPIRLHTWTGQPWAVMEPGVTRTLAKAADRLIGRLNTQCYADSESQMRLLISEGIVTPDRISVVGGNSNAGVDIERFNPARWSPQDRLDGRLKLGIPPASTVIIFVGRITRDKGIVELVAAFQSMLAGGRNIDLILVGPLDHEKGGRVSLLESDVAVHPRIHRVGYTSTPEDYLALGDIFCLPSYREGFGTVVIEAAAMGLPAVGTRIVGLVDAIADRQSGILIEPRSESALEAGLAELIDSPSLRAQMGLAARERCVLDFTQEKISSAVLEEYMRLLAAKNLTI